MRDQNESSSKATKLCLALSSDEAIELAYKALELAEERLGGDERVKDLSKKIDKLAKNVWENKYEHI